MRLTKRTDAFTLSLAKVIEELRKKQGLSQTRLAEMAGLSQSMIGLVERGQRVPTVATLYRLAVNLNAKPEDIIKEARLRVESV